MSRISGNFGITPMAKSLMTSTSAIELNKEFLKLTSENIAHAGIKATEPGADAYRAKIPVIGTKIDPKTGAQVLFLKKVMSDQTPQEKEYDPDHPGAGPDGMVAKSNVSTIIEKLHLSEYLKSAQANIKAYEAAKTMIRRELELLRP
jgi:flagellar basal-body rod protein FlgC